LKNSDLKRKRHWWKTKKKSPRQKSPKSQHSLELGLRGKLGATGWPKENAGGKGREVMEKAIL